MMSNGVGSCPSLSLSHISLIYVLGFCYGFRGVKVYDDLADRRKKGRIMRPNMGIQLGEL